MSSNKFSDFDYDYPLYDAATNSWPGPYYINNYPNSWVTTDGISVSIDTDSSYATK